MLKIVPDPPFSPERCHVLEDLLMQLCDRLFSAVAVTQQNAQLQTTASGRGLSLAALHELEAASSLLEAALGKVQVRH